MWIRPDPDQDPGSQTNVDPSGSGSWSDFSVTKLNFYINKTVPVLYVGTRYRKSQYGTVGLNIFRIQIYKDKTVHIIITVVLLAAVDGIFLARHLFMYFRTVQGFSLSYTTLLQDFLT